MITAEGPVIVSAPLVQQHALMCQIIRITLQYSQLRHVRPLGLLDPEVAVLINGITQMEGSPSAEKPRVPSASELQTVTEERTRFCLQLAHMAEAVVLSLVQTWRPPGDPIFEVSFSKRKRKKKKKERLLQLNFFFQI